MSKKKSSWKHKLAAVLVSFVMIVIVLLLGEAFCRLFTRINFLDNSRGLITANRFGKSYGNTPNYEGISFGETFYTDANGFRIDPKFAATAPQGAPGLLVIGDSVAFGSAVKEEQTIAGHLRRKLPDLNVYNAAAIGYDTFDYKNVVTEVIKQKPDIKTVALFYCLNDLNDVSAQQLRAEGAKDLGDAPTTSPNPVRLANDFLRSRSKLYLAIKGAMQDTQMLYFRNDLSFYQKDDATISAGLQPLADIKKTLDEAGIKFYVFVLPYEVQLRKDATPEFKEPQAKISKFLTENKISFFDPFEDFRANKNPNGLYLFGDPMHLSAEGNKLAAEIACTRLRTDGIDCKDL